MFYINKLNIYKILKIIYTTTSLLLCIVAILTVDTVAENIKVDNMLKEFMDNGVEVGTHGRFTFYEVVIEEKLTTPSIVFEENGNPLSATPGDIFILRESMFDYIPYSAEFITFYFGGHAGLIYDENYVLETTGLEVNPEDNAVIMYSNNILFRPERVSTVGLRVKASEEEVDKALQYAYSTIGIPYNYSFIFDRKNTFYCTDLVSRSYGKEANLDFILDKDGIAVSCNDLIISEDTFITYYMWYEGFEKHLYYAVNK